MSTEIPRLRAAKKAKNLVFDYSIGDLIVVPVKDRWVLAVVVSEYGETQAAWDDFHVILPPGSGRLVRRSGAKPSMGKLIGHSWPSIQAAADELRGVSPPA